MKYGFNLNLWRLFQKILWHFYSWHTLSKIVVFESDDWGQRGLNISQLENLSKNFSAKDFIVPLTYNKNLNWLRDTLELEEDLEKLYCILEKHIDSRGRHPIFTANLVVTNPDYNAIKNENFNKYIVVEPSNNLTSKWKEGRKRGVFFPQYHGFAHFNYEQWLDDLRNNNYSVRKAFDLGLSLPIFDEVKMKHGYKGEYVELGFSPSSVISYNRQKEIMNTGMAIFKKIFGYASCSTIAPFRIWDECTEQVSNELGIKYIQGADYHIIGRDGQGNLITKNHYLGEKNKWKQLYLVRNCNFEPFGEKPNEWQDTLKEIERAFKRGYPAIIDTHRINYSGGVDSRMRDSDLLGLDILLQNIEKKYPKVLYLTSVELGELIENGSFHDVISGIKVNLPRHWFSQYDRWLLKSLKYLLFVSFATSVFIAISQGFTLYRYLGKKLFI